MHPIAILWYVAVAQIPAPQGEWPVYGHDAGGSRYSPLTQVSRTNVRELRPAWVYRTGDLLHDRSRFEATPLMVDGTLYVSTPLGRVIALDPARGRERWRYDPRVDLHGDYGDFTNRGVSTWLDSRGGPGAACRRRIFVATVDARLIGLDAATGRPCADFGAAGTVDLTRDLRNAPEYAGEYEVTSPPAVVGDLVIVGSAVADNHRVNAPNGVVRAYDARTGRERWSWDPIARAPGMPGAANAWSVFSADPERDLVFVPIGSASPDFYGGARAGDNRWANSVVALRASTGQFVWGFQVVHHDLWDDDVPAQAVLLTLRRGARAIPAVAVGTKMGHVFILDRLLARMRVALRHAARGAGQPEEPVFAVGELRVDRERRRVHVGEREVHLTPLEYKLLAALVRHAGKVLTHGHLLKEVWGTHAVTQTPTLRVHMTQLRHKLERDPAQPRYLLTETGVGYRLRAE